MEKVIVIYFCDKEAYIPMQELFLCEELQRYGIDSQIQPVLAHEDIAQIANELNSGSSQKIVFWMERPYVTAKHYEKCISLSRLVTKRKYFGGIFGTMMCDEIWEADPAFDVIFSGFNMERIANNIAHNDHRTGIIEAHGAIDINKYELKLDYLSNRQKFPSKKAYGYYTSIGCPNNCHFCFNNCLKSFGLKYSQRSNEKVRSDLSKIQKFFGCESITFKDLNFFHNPNAMTILEYARESGLSVSGNLDITLNNISENIISRLSEEYGIRDLFFGLESLSQDTLDRLNKPSKIDHIYEVVKWIDRYDIHIHGIIMFGFPWQTPESIMSDLKTSFGLMRKAKNVHIRFSPYMPLPRTSLQEKHFSDCYSTWNHREKIKAFDTSKYNRRTFPFNQQIQNLDPYYMSLCSRNYLTIRKMTMAKCTNFVINFIGRHILTLYEYEMVNNRYGARLRLINKICQGFF